MLPLLMREGAQRPQSDKRGWKLREQASFGDLLAFLGCIVNIMDAFDTIRESDPRHSLRLVFVARRVSVSLRKMMLDGGGRLLKSCLHEPRIHPLKPPAPSARQVVAVQKLRAVEVKAVSKERGKEATFDAPEGEHRITIDPLFGVRYEDEGVFAMESPFELEEEPIKFKSWLTRKVLQVDDMVFRAVDLLRLVANKEGAHIERGDHVILPDASAITMESKNAKYEAVNALKFGGLSYPQIFCMFTALYVVRRSRDLLDGIRRMNDDMVSLICDRIAEYRTALLVRGYFASESARVFLVDSDWEPNMDSVGDSYSTTVTIP